MAYFWRGDANTIAQDQAGIHACIAQLDQPLYVLDVDGFIGFTNHGDISTQNGIYPVLAFTPPTPADSLGSAVFRHVHGVKYAYMAGAMANGIASADMVIALGRAGMLGSFGAAGLVPARIEEAIHQIKSALPNQPYAFNLIHSPSEMAIEQRAVDLFLAHGIHTVEASAFLEVTPTITYYRVAGLSQAPDGSIIPNNRVIAKISRKEVAEGFMSPPPAAFVADLLAQGKISPQQAEWAQYIPMADDVTCEADSGGHTDNRPLSVLLPVILELRDQLQARFAYATPIRVGAGGGIGTPSAVLGAYMMGAGYVVTGSVNQSCIEAGASVHTKRLLAQADMTDVMMAPAADMFEMGVKLQVLKKGTLFPLRAQKLYDLYREYESIEAIPADERAKIEKTIFRRDLDAVWRDTVAYFEGRDPEQIHRANANPKAKMALIFRWYLGLSSRWSNSGEAGREMDYQIWCGPAMGAFNDWVRGTSLEHAENRRVADVAEHLMRGAAIAYRANLLRVQGVDMPNAYVLYKPM
jgi:PfaD family protein